MKDQREKVSLVEVDLGGSGQFEAVGAMTVFHVDFRRGPVDLTNLQSLGGWREYGFDAGQMSATIDGRCFLTSQGERIASSGESRVFRIEIPGHGVLSGTFKFTKLEWPKLDAVECSVPYNVTLQSAGPFSVTPPQGEGAQDEKHP
jgi:predicted secreted protein